MDMSIIIVVWIVVMVVQGALDKKKPTSNPPPNLPQNNSPDFEIPTLANDPNFPGEENSVLIQDATQPAEVREINLSELYRQKKILSQAENKFSEPEVQTKSSEVEKKNFALDLTPSATMNAIILGEILSKPKFKR